jgi:2-oxoglutarate dehydrogenase complex dehydrogenase (E1) component-like enzyme
VLHDSETGEEFVALHHLDDCAASFTASFKMEANASDSANDHSTLRSSSNAFARLSRILFRLTGQDSERGTFAQRNLVLHDSETGEEFVALHHLSKRKRFSQ